MKQNTSVLRNAFIATLITFSSMSMASAQTLDCDAILSDRTTAFDNYSYDPSKTWAENVAIYNALGGPDGDGLNDDQETCFGSDPNLKDSDLDGIDDDYEFVNMMDGSVLTGNDGQAMLDLDRDNLITLDEVRLGLDPANEDVDGDELVDGYEYLNSLNPKTNYGEADWLYDGKTHREWQAGKTLGADYDNDGIVDADEPDCAFDPYNDIDGDGICANMNCTACDIPGSTCPAYCKVADNCPGWYNPPVVLGQPQADSNGDKVGDACQCGDINGDGMLTAQDLSLFNQKNFSIIPNANSLNREEMHKCDINGDGVCSEADRVYLADYLNGQVPESDLHRRCADKLNSTRKMLARVGYGFRNNHTSFQTLENIAKAPFNIHIQDQLNQNPANDERYQTYKSLYGDDHYGLAVMGKSYAELRNLYCGSSPCLTGHSRIPRTLAEVRLGRSVESDQQLKSVLSEFWFNHFNVYGGLGHSIWLLPQYQDIIDNNLDSKFEDFLLDITRAPAMLSYLNLHNSKTNDPNQNFAREVMELHSIGPIDTYDAVDIDEVSRILTGYIWVETTPTADNPLGTTYQFRSGSTYHDPNPKTVTMEKDGMITDTWKFAQANPAENSTCEKDLPEGSTQIIAATAGENEVEVLMCLLARHPLTAERIGKKLMRRFFGDEIIDTFPTRAENPILDDFVNTWVATDGDLKVVIGQLLQSIPQDTAMGHYLERSVMLGTQKIKNPLVFSSSLLRVTDSPFLGNSTFLRDNNYEDSFYGIMGDMEDAGYSQYRVSPPTGVSEKSGSWVSANTAIINLNQVNRVIGINSGLPLNAWYYRRHVTDEDEWVDSIEHFFDFIYDTNAHVQLLAESLLPGTGLDRKSHREIVNYLVAKHGEIPRRQSSEPDLSYFYSTYPVFNAKNRDAVYLIMSQPRAFYH